MRLASVQPRKADAAPIVLGDTNGFQMVWIHAPAIAAQMVQRKAIWDRPYQRLVDCAMGDYLSGTAIVNPVAV